MTLRQKLLAAFAGLVAVAMLTAGAALFATVRWQTTASDMETHYQRSLLLQRVRAGTFQALKEVDDALTADNVDARADFARALAPTTRDFEAWASLADTHAERGEVQRIRQAHRRLITNANRVFALLPDNRAAAIQLVDEEVDTGDYENFRVITERAVQADRRRRVAVRAETAQLRTTTQIMLAVAALSVLSLALLIAAYLSHDLFRPLRRLAETARRIGVGDVKARADEDRDDEIGDLGRALNVLAVKVSAESGEEQVVDRTDRARLQALSAELQVALGSLDGSAGRTDQASLDQLARIAQDIARWADHSAPFDLQLETLDLAPLIHDVLTRFHRALGDGAVSIELDLGQAPERIVADRLKLREAIDEVVRNALDALPERGGRIGFRTYQAGGLVRIEVADSGRGMSSDLIEQARTRHGPDGALRGLGRARSIMEQHGGSLALFSESGKGTVVQFALPHRP